MAFGISAGTIFSAVAPAVIGGVMGGRKGATDQTTSNAKSMDPRVEKMYFGEDGSGGLLGDLNNWYQAYKTGLNSDMQAGLDHMKSVYQSPLATQGYDRMANTGYDLMGRGVAENPSLTGNMPNFGYLQGQQQPQFQTPQMPQFTRGGQMQAPQPPSETPQAPQQQQVVAPVAQTANLGLTQPLSLSNGWAAPAPTPAPAAPAAPAARAISSQDEFQRMYEAEMARQRKEWENSASSNWNTGYGD